MTTAAVIVAAGRGTRVGGPVPKQWRMLRGRAVVAWTLAAFRASPHIDHIVLVLNESDMDMAHGYTAHPDVSVAQGGASRAASVLAGLISLQDQGVTRVLIHDVARPLVSLDLIARIHDALDHHVGAAPALPVSDALWLGDGGTVAGTRDRTHLYRAQTPQGFHFDAILAAHRAHTGLAADDVEVARAAGLNVRIVDGDEANLKITTAGDFARAEHLMERHLDIRTGNGFDVHAFCAGDHVVLCGLKIPHDKGLLGHSDADVGMHTVTDAIYGALAEGDIGRHFPPSDPQWKGAASEIFLRHAVGLAKDRGYRISNVDLTLICEAPKIGPHADDMIAHMAALMGLSADRVSVKATTSERLGFTGRGEGIAAMATVTLVSA
ncbi:bifunctional 2-C-methyl-D-erythritol 4-phosphate cytidylyltransferase/2-C-methyl-D-erythritol 2,4-cyclodiphosphate synthase [Oceaniglobus ichthyenteri]|uniref:bifunctional 2-C-methyl-D-erythritol 4-phosphate cytidylyltransferase/2-C-methyl-D-erythritol 2,4-cyclodiphosphate synthase n=1 Tax=Oceaniglobus ichthyenteri TaxID=2136177 RepID=UPI000D3A9297|nr:bifunctional 2-C-methyl-D-erythritol 4-phosphate cytidylyltransferase/2-C-methyl-D-erythritol 2,4-cyclodiphosphate synthase [Oceaniglobus ichthyenteri]